MAGIDSKVQHLLEVVLLIRHFCSDRFDSKIWRYGEDYAAFIRFWQVFNDENKWFQIFLTIVNILSKTCG